MADARFGKGRLARSSAAPRAPGLRIEPVQLPKSGGAITGLTEQFALDESSGTAQLHIPFELPTARGLAPDLTLTYASSGGNGPFGVGFSLSQSSIARMTNKGIPRYDHSDRFSLNGGPALVPLPDAPPARIVEGRTYHVTTYRPRSFTQETRIEQWSASDGSGSFWRTIDAGNHITVYGRTPSARIADPADPDRVFEWLIEWEADARGNAIAYNYKTEDDQGLAGRPGEINRVHGANRYLQRIRYANAVPAGTAPVGIDNPDALTWLIEVVADYGEYDISTGNDLPCRPVRAWPARRDPFSTYGVGFERRTARLCRSLLQFHRFDELGPDPVLVRALTFQYYENPTLARLTGATITGFRHNANRPAGQRYQSRSLPPLRLDYTPFSPDAARFVPIARGDGSPLPGVDAPFGYSLVDLYGHGAPGILYADGQSTFYRAPRAANCGPSGTLSYQAPHECPQFAMERRISGPDLALADLDGDGRLELAVAGADRAGSYRILPDGTWSPFRPFEAIPTEYHAPAAEHADLSGGGAPGVVLVGATGVRYYPSAGVAGYGAPVERRAVDPPPPVLAFEPHALVRFADLCGTGGPQRIRIADGRVTCWPSLGHGSFAPPVDLARVPLFGDAFDVRRVFLADLDGTGASDLIYVEATRLLIWQNQSGNGFAGLPLVIPLPSRCTDPDQIRVADARGNGWDCLILGVDSPEPQQWILDLCGGVKPWLLNRISNGLGAETRIQYASSTRFQLEDREAGRPWSTSLPFPVQVVARVEDHELISGQCRVTEYRYRNGVMDGVERAFRGFGLIERRETEALPDPAPGVSTPATTLLTRVWYHTGLAPGSDPADQAFAGDGAAYAMPGMLCEWPDGFAPDAETLRQAAAALVGNILREEVHAIGAGEPVPFSATRTRYRARMLQAPGAHEAVFLVGEAENIEYEYEGDPTDPRVSHDYTLAVDDDGTIRQSASIDYPRRDKQKRQDPQQGETRAALGVFTQVPRQCGPDTLLFGLAQEERNFALSGLPAPDAGLYVSLVRMTALAAAALAGAPGAPATELLGRTRHLWVTDGGVVTPQALVLRTDEAVFTADAVAAAMDGVPVPGGLDAFLAGAGGYLRDDGMWWQPGAEASYAPARHFHVLAGTRDAFARRADGPSGTIVACTHDAYDLLVTDVTTSGRDADVLPHRVTATRIDHHTLSPLQITDSNGTVTEVLLDPLGHVLARSKRGQEWNGTASVPVGFAPLPVEDPASWPVPPSAAALLADPARFLGGAEAIFYTEFPDPSGPAAPIADIAVYATSYPTAAAPDLPGGLVDLGVTWTDGHGRTVQTSEYAGPGQWRISGRAILLTDGQIWRHFHPAYAATSDFIAAAALATLRIATTHFYDPLGRPVRTAIPRADLWEAFFSTTAYDAWQVTESDPDDTVKDSAWYRRHVEPGDPKVPPLPPAERDALIQAARFHGTPSTTVLGSSGIPVRQIARPTAAEANALVTRHRLDAAGRVDGEADPRLGAKALWNLERHFTLAGDPFVVTSVDGGKASGLTDAVGNPILAFDALGRTILTRHDSFARLTTIVLRNPDGTTRTVERLVYGDSLDGIGQTVFPDGAGRNLSGQVVQHYDPAGFTETSAYALCDEPLAVSRAFLADFAAEVDWSHTPASGWTWKDQATTLGAALDTAPPFAITRVYDALGRPVGGTDPDLNRTDITFGPGGHITALAVAPNGAQGFTYLDQIVYDADGRRTAERASGPGGAVLDRSFVHDPDNRRLTGITTRRRGDAQVVQDIRYVYDPAGNVMHVDDAAAPGVSMIAGGQLVTAARDFTYDALYRLIGATGRAHSALTRTNDSSGGYDAFFGAGGPLSDPASLYRYTAGYCYDHGTNLTRIRFTAPPALPAASWTRTMVVDATSNRAVGADPLDGKPIAASFDAAGNQTLLDGRSALVWDYRNRLRQVVLVARDGGEPDAQFLAHDGSGQRVRKTTRRLVSAGTWRVTDTFYFGGFEITRERLDKTVVEECHRLRLMDEEAAVAEWLVWTVGTPPAGVTGPQWRFQIDDRQGSSSLELDDQGRLVSYEEYAPYGGTVYATGPSLAQVSLKRYRFSRKERDRDTGLYDYGARRYMPWLGRWLSPDPAGPVDGLNLYAFVGGNPVTWEDAGGFGRVKQNTRPTKRQGPKKKGIGIATKSSRGFKRGGGKTTAAMSPAALRRQRRMMTPGRQSSRLLKVREQKAAQFAAPSGTLGHYYSGFEHVDSAKGKALFGSTTALRDDILNKLYKDLKSSTALSGVPKDLSDFAANNWKRNDFLDAVAETVPIPNTKLALTRPKFSVGKIVPRDGSGAKIGASDPYGGINTKIDDRGHLVPEKGVSDTNAVRVNSPDNVVAENWVINQRYKTAFEQGVKEFAAQNPTLHVMTIHVPIYTSSKGAAESLRTRPKAILHLAAINGTIISAFTFKNTKHTIELRG